MLYTPLLSRHRDGDGRQMRSLERANFSMIRQGKMQTWAGGQPPIAAGDNAGSLNAVF